MSNDQSSIVGSPAEPPASAPQWIPVSERMPRSGSKVLVFYRNSYGLGRRTCAHFAAKHTIEAIGWNDDAETDDTEDGSFEPEGWWEEPTEAEQMALISGVTHWMPLPRPPEDSTE